MKLPPAITSKSNARVKALRSAFSGRASQPGDLVGIEGIRMLAEAFRSRVRIDAIYVREGAEESVRLLPGEMLTTAPFTVLRSDVFDSALDTQHSQPIAATCEIPARLDPKLPEGEGVLLVLEGVQDPGNLGTLIRSAEAFAAQRIFLTPGTANAWNPKVVRASAGSVFRAPLVKATLQELKQLAVQRKIRLLAAVADGQGALVAPEADLRPPCALMIGNEGNGLSDEALAIADQRVYIPCLTESLNAGVAGSVLLYEALRQRIGRTAAAIEAEMPQRVL